MRHLDEGTIHGWLDGALGADEARAVESHIAECRDCASSVAEARGLIAGASRVLVGLDAVPAGVLPARHRSGEAGASDRHGWGRDRATAAVSRWRGFRASRLRVAAAVAFLAAGAVTVARTVPPASRGAPAEVLQDGVEVGIRHDDTGSSNAEPPAAPTPEPAASKSPESPRSQVQGRGRARPSESAPSSTLLRAPAPAPSAEGPLASSAVGRSAAVRAEARPPALAAELPQERSAPAVLRGAAVTDAALELAKEARVARIAPGCFVLTRGPWLPAASTYASPSAAPAPAPRRALAPGAGEPLEPPRAFELDTVAPDPRRGGPELRALALDDGPPGVAREGRWQPAGASSIVLTWSGASGAVRMTLHVEGDALRGEAVTIPERESARRSDVTARRTACTPDR